MPRNNASTRPLAVGAVLASLTVVATGCGSLEDSDEDFPSEAIEVIVPWTPGGSGDQTARLLATEAEKTCGTDVIVRNQEGSSGAVAYEATENSDPNGYTVSVVGAELAILDHFGVASISPDDVRGVMQYSLQPIAYGVPQDSSLETIDDVIASAEQERMSVATSGTGSIYHVGFAGMAAEAGLGDELINVPFEGAASALQAALGGQTDLVSVGAAELAPQVQSGELRPVAVAAEEPPDGILEGVPTLKENGMDWVSGAFLGLIVSADTPDARVEKLNQCFGEARQADQFTSYMENQGFTQEYRNSAEFDAFLESEHERYGDIVEETGISPEDG